MVCKYQMRMALVKLASIMASGRYVLTKSDFQSCSSNTLQELFTDNHFSDVTLVSEDEKEIKAHKVILASASSFFRRMLIRYEQQKPLIYLKGIRFSDLQALIRFIYVGEAEINQENLEKFLDSAKLLEIQGIMDESIGSEGRTALMENKVPYVKEGSKVIKEEITDTKENTIEETIEETDEVGEDFKEGQFHCAQCDYRTSRRRNLTIHKTKKRCRLSKERKYPCKQCDRAFKKNSSLWRHKKSEHNGMLYKCDDCDYVSKWSSNLSYHKNKLHKNVD